MLQAPAFTQINDVTIFDDDVLFYKFYPIAAAPSIRLDGNGRPIFLLVKYALSDEDRIADPTLPAGGGYLNFDIQFDVAAADLAIIREQLQPIVDARWRQLRAGTAAQQAQPGVVGTTEPPKVEIGAPTWTGGKVKMNAPQATTLVDTRVAEAEPSLLAGNIAVFNMDLTPAGATFMQRTLVEPTGEGIDLTPIQVAYDLKFWARLPPVRIHINVDSEKIHNYVNQLYQANGWRYYYPYGYYFGDFDTTYDNMMMTGAIDVQIDNGSGSLPEEVIEELRTYSFDLVKQMIQSNFFSDTPPDPPAGEEQPDRKDHYYYDERYFKQEYSAAEMTITFNLEQRSVIEWMIHPQATLETFFRDMSPAEIKQFVRSINLDDDFFANLQLEVRAFANFDDANIANVEVQVHYEGADENGETREKNETFTFTNSNPQRWSVSLIGSEREYQYRYRVGFKGLEAAAFTEWTKSKSPDLNIVANPGKINLTVLTGDIDYEDLVQQVQVRLAYEDSERGVPREEGIVVLDKTQREARYQRAIFKPQHKPIYYLRRFRMTTGDVFEDPEWIASTNHELLTINQPFISKLEVGLLPTGDGWEDIDTVLIDLKYTDMGNNYTVQDRLMVKSKSEFKTWTVSLRNRDLRAFQYRWLASYKNGYLDDSGWQTGNGSDTYPILVKQQGIKIRILPDTLDFTASPLTEVHLRYQAAGIDRQETLAFRDKTPQIWSFAAPQGAPIEYTYQITHYPVNDDPVQLPAVTEHDTLVVLKPYRPLTGGKLTVQVFATIVDFSVTPLVTVDLRYDDDHNNVYAVGALTFTDNKPQSWEVTVKDINVKQFSYTVTYFTMDGAEHPQAPKAQDAPRVIIPKFTA